MKDDKDSAGGHASWLYHSVRPLGHRYQKCLKSKHPLIDVYTLLYLKWATNKSLLYITGNSAQYYVTT